MKWHYRFASEAEFGVDEEGEEEEGEGDEEGPGEEEILWRVGGSGWSGACFAVGEREEEEDQEGDEGDGAGEIDTSPTTGGVILEGDVDHDSD